jgi:FkbM family methyltransferase
LTLRAVSYPVVFSFSVISRRWLGRDVVNPDMFLLCDLVLENEDGLFHCRRKTGDFITVSVRSENYLRRFFDVEEGIFVDIGANIGKYTVMVGKRLGSDGKVIAIEPEPENFQALLKNIEANRLKNVVPLNIACCSANGEARLYLHRYAPGLHTTAANHKQQLYRQVIVPGRTLDSILKELAIEKVKLLKIDVEDAELEVLKGAIELLRHSQELRIIIEVWHEESLEFLTGLGFRVSKICEQGREYVAERVKG